ncbi:MAG TPA: type VI secretion system protein TssA [Planctomycetaceae bacterium]|nr:type VI secretion system protein TssA [Planctomycetaceae bacterium]
MSTITSPSIPTWLESLGTDHPSGPSLEYDALFIAMERAASGREEQQFGQTVIDAEPPQWAAVRKLATELLQRTHDLRIGVYLAESVIESEGLAGFTECLEMLATWLRCEWDTVHPQLDAEDEFDPTVRVNTLTRLTDARRILERLRMVPLTDVRGLGTVTLGDLIKVAEANASDHDSIKTIEATLSGGPTEPLITSATLLRNAMVAVSRLDQVLCDRIGVAKSVEFAPLIRILKMPQSVLADRLERRGIRLEKFAPAEAPPAHADVIETGSQDSAPVRMPRAMVTTASLDQPDESQSSTVGVSPRDWQIASRDDVTSALDRLCGYFAQYEPSSPIPLLLARAKRLVPMTFLEILQELGPDVLTQAQRLQGEAR